MDDKLFLIPKFFSLLTKAKGNGSPANTTVFILASFLIFSRLTHSIGSFCYLFESMGIKIHKMM